MLNSHEVDSLSRDGSEASHCSDKISRRDVVENLANVGFFAVTIAGFSSLIWKPREHVAAFTRDDRERLKICLSVPCKWERRDCGQKHAESFMAKSPDGAVLCVSRYQTKNGPILELQLIGEYNNLLFKCPPYSAHIRDREIILALLDKGRKSCWPVGSPDLSGLNLSH